MKRIIAFSALLLFLSTTAFAHSGRTDSKGGHRDNNNVSGLGYYHYHHGKPPHLHTNGICPYSDDSSSSETSVPYRYSPSLNKESATTEDKSNDNSDNKYNYIILGAFIGAIAIYSIRKKRHKAKEEERKRIEEKRIRDEYVELYGGKDIGELVNMPNDTEVGDDGLPREKYSNQYWGGKYTFYTSKTGKYFHRIRGCNTYATIATHAYKIHGLNPCRKCNPVLPDLSWYQEYKKITNIKAKYRID